MDLVDMLTTVNVPSADDGEIFTDSTRIDAVLQCLQGTAYRALRAEGIAYVVARQGYDARRGTVLISCHIDYAYRKLFWMAGADGVYRGTFDNAITLSVLVLAMRRESLPPQTLVAFTGDEEEDGQGAEETLTYLRAHHIDPELVICLDVTEEGYGQVSYTLENLLPRTETPAMARMRFPHAEAFRQFLFRMLGQPAFTVIDAEPDEAWVYDEEDVNCFTLCLPAFCPAGMHDDCGIFIRQADLEPYMHALETMCQQVCRYLAGEELFP
jgi:hypothetical protein